MIIAVIAVGVVQMTVDQIVHVIAVGDGFVTTVRSMDVARIVTGATVRRRTCVRVGIRDGDRVFIDVTIVGMMQVPVMEVVDVSVMRDGLVATVGPVDMVV